MKAGQILPVILLALFLLSSCKEGGTFSFEKPPPDRAVLQIDAPAAGVYWQKKKVNCQNGESELCSDLPLLVEQLGFPPRSETLRKTLADDYDRLQEKAKFSKEIISTKTETSLPPSRSETLSFSVAGQKLTVIVSGSVADVRNILLSPSGRSILPGSSLHQKTPYLERFIIANPEAGQWRLVSRNLSPSKPVYYLSIETFASPFPSANEAIDIKGELLDDGEVVLTAKESSSEEEAIYEWDLGDGWAGEGRVIGHNFSEGTYLPELLTLRQGVGETLTQAPFVIQKKKGQPPVIIPINAQRKKRPSPPKILRAKIEGDQLRVAALEGEKNGGGSLTYQYSLDQGGSWQDAALDKGYFLLPAPEAGARLQFRSLNSRGSSQGSTVVCNFSGFYPLEARARGMVAGQKVNLEILAGGCPGERWNILAPLWKRAGIF